MLNFFQLKLHSSRETWVESLTKHLTKGKCWIQQQKVSRKFHEMMWYLLIGWSFNINITYFPPRSNSQTVSG